MGIVALSPQIGDAARKKARSDNNQDRGDTDSGENRTDREKGNRDDKESNKNESSESRTENRDSNKKSDESDKRDRIESREDGQSDSHAESQSRVSRREEKRQDAEAESRESSEKNEDDGDEENSGGKRRSQEFAQDADDEPAYYEPEGITFLQTNPNVVLDDLPETSSIDLVVEVGDDVIASVSTSGGFAFARSGGVTAVTGPDGASIIQNGGTGAPADDEPSDDGGNNDLDFSS